MDERRDPDVLRRRAGVRGDPDRDQHFLVDDRVLDRLPAYARAALTAADGSDGPARRDDPPAGRSPGDDPAGDRPGGLDPPADRSRGPDAGGERSLGRVLEIGAGTGALTVRLLEAADRVTAIERDPILASFLDREFADFAADGRLTVVEGDALEVALPTFDVCVSNLPYGAASEFVFRLLRRGRPTVLTVQREFGERMAAEAGEDDYGRLSVTAGHHANVEILEVVPPTAFDPQPAVESAVVRTVPRAADYAVPDEAFFMDFLRAVFTQRRKTLRNAIRNTAHISGLGDHDALVAAADEAVLSARPGDLSPATFAELATLAHGVGEPDRG